MTEALTDHSLKFGKPVSLLFIVLCAAWFANIQSVVLTEPDEGRYAEIPREMLASGDWVTPRLNGIVYFEKPPLQYWITAAAYRAFGESAWTSRLWTFTASFLGVLVILFTGTALYGERTGIIAALVLASSPLYFFVGHINTLDAGLTFLMSSALAAFLLAKNAADGSRRRRAWMALAWVATSLAVLSKGPVALVVPAVSIILHASIERSMRIFRDMAPLIAVAALASIAAPWFVLVSMRNPGFANFFFVHEHLARYATTGHGRVQAWWFFPLILAAGVFPWLIPSMRAWYSALAERTQEGFATGRFLGIYALVVLVFFSASGSKLAPYVDPAVPALSLMTAYWIGRKGRATPRNLVLFVWVSGILLIAGIPYLQWRMQNGSEAGASTQFSVWMFGSAVLWLLGALLAYRFAWRSNMLAAIACIALPWVCGSQLLMHGLNAFASTRSGIGVAQALERIGAADRPIYTVDRYLQTVPFYLRRTVVVVGYPGELEVALDPHTGNWLPGLNEFASRWKADDRPLAIIDRDIWPGVLRLGLSMRPFFSDSRVVLVEGPAASAMTQVNAQRKQR